jgi:hypothetical protein
LKRRCFRKSRADGDGVIMAFTRQTKISREVARNSKKLLGLQRTKDLRPARFRTVVESKSRWLNQDATICCKLRQLTRSPNKASMKQLTTYSIQDNGQATINQNEKEIE